MAENNNITITVAIIFHNEQNHLPSLLESFSSTFGQKDQDHIQILFIDNDSSDNSHEIIEKWQSQSPLNVRYHRRSKNHMAQARTEALELSQTKWVAFVDADTALKPDWSQMLMKTLAGLSTDIVAVGGGSDYQPKNNWQRYANELAQYFPLGKKYSQQVIVDHVPTNNYLVRRKVALDLGGFDDFFQRVGEDLDFNVRLRKVGKIAYDPSFKVEHFFPPTVYDWYRKMALYGRAQSFIVLRHGGGLPITKFFPLLFVVILNLVIIDFPEAGLALMVFALLIPRTRFFLLTFLFYGLGECVGAIIYLYLNMNLFSPKVFSQGTTERQK